MDSLINTTGYILHLWNLRYNKILLLHLVQINMIYILKILSPNQEMDHKIKYIKNYRAVIFSPLTKHTAFD